MKFVEVLADYGHKYLLNINEIKSVQCTASKLYIIMKYDITYEIENEERKKTAYKLLREVMVTNE